MSTTFVTKANGQVTRIINMADIMAALRQIYDYDTNEQVVSSALNIEVTDLINGLINNGIDIHPVLDALRLTYGYSTIDQLLSSNRVLEVSELIRILSQYGFS